jgi:quinol-cytochrome oxidoreductase complex cytochrome b subunit
LFLVAVLIVSGLVLTWTYEPPPGDPAWWRLIHQAASVLLLPATWTLAVAGVLVARRRAWLGPAALAVVALAAAFTGYLLPWEAVTIPDAVVLPEFSGMGVAFDGRIDLVQVGGTFLARSTYRRYVLAHLLLGAGVAVLVGLPLVRRRRP